MSGLGKLWLIAAVIFVVALAIQILAGATSGLGIVTSIIIATVVAVLGAVLLGFALRSRAR